MTGRSHLQKSIILAIQEALNNREDSGWRLRYRKPLDDYNEDPRLEGFILYDDRIINKWQRFTFFDYVENLEECDYPENLEEWIEE